MADESYRPKGSAIEQAKARQRQRGIWWDFRDLVDGKRQRTKPGYFRRADGQYLFYHGKENAIVGETEAGKDMILAELTAQCIDDGLRVCWVDFEEGDEIDCGHRLLELGVEPSWLCDHSMFLFATPEDTEQARDNVNDAIHAKKKPDIVILNGIQAAYALFGWDLNDPDSTRRFRKEIVRPLLDAGLTVIETDHVSKDASNRRNGTRYASGGMAKLNWVSGAAYMIRAVTPIVRGSNGKSELILTKDRPGGVKPSCAVIDNEARMMHAGTLTVKSHGNEDDGWELSVEIIPPRQAEDNFVMVNGRKISVEVIEQVIEMYKASGPKGTSKKSIEDAYKGPGARQVRGAIEVAKAYGCIVPASRSQTSNIAPLRYAKDWGSKAKVSRRD